MKLTEHSSTHQWKDYFELECKPVKSSETADGCVYWSTNIDWDLLILMKSWWSSGDPPPEVVWLHDGQEVTESEDFHLHREGNHCTLLIQEVFPEDTGTYSCQAWNQYGEDHTQAQLTVEGKL